MTITHDAQARALWRANQEALAALAPPATRTGSNAELHLDYLVAQCPGLELHRLCDDSGRWWSVTKLRLDLYLVSGPRYAECRTAAEVVEMMEASR